MRNTGPRATASGWPVLVGGEYEAESTNMLARAISPGARALRSNTRVPRVDVLYLHGSQSGYPCPVLLVGPRGLGQTCEMEDWTTDLAAAGLAGSIIATNQDLTVSK